MKIDDWIYLLHQIKDGKLNNVHPSFPEPLIYGMKITNDGVLLLVTEEGFCEERWLEQSHIIYKNSKPVDISYKKGRESYEALKDYADSLESQPKDKKDVKKLFRKKKLKKKKIVHPV